MALSAKIKAIFLLVNYGLAAYIPPQPYGLPGAQSSDYVRAVSLFDRAPAMSSAPDYLLPRAESDGTGNGEDGDGDTEEDEPEEGEPEEGEPEDGDDEDGDDENGDDESCDDEDDCKKCPANQINDPKDCKKCTTCAKGTKPDADGKKCVKEKNGDDKDKDKEKKKEDRYKKAKEKKKEEYKKKAAERKEKKYKDTKKKMQDKWNAWDKKRRDDTKRRQVRRVGRCLTIVQLIMDDDTIKDYGNEFFSEGFLESMDLVELWPEGAGDAKFLNDYIDSEEYLDEWVKFANDNDPVKRSVPAPVAEPIPVPELQEVAVYGDPNLEKRCIPACLIPIFAAIFGTAARIGARAAAAGGRIAAAITKNTIKVAKGAGKVARVKQLEGAKKIAKNKNWQRCIRGQSPTK